MLRFFQNLGFFKMLTSVAKIFPLVLIISIKSVLLLQYFLFFICIWEIAYVDSFYPCLWDITFIFKFFFIKLEEFSSLQTRKYQTYNFDKSDQLLSIILKSIKIAFFITLFMLFFCFTQRSIWDRINEFWQSWKEQIATSSIRVAKMSNRRKINRSCCRYLV